MFHILKHHLQQVITLNIVFLLLLISPASGSNEDDDLFSDENIISMINTIEPMIEEITGRKYSGTLEYKITVRDDLYDLLFDEIFPQLKKFSNEDDDSIARTVETQAFNAGQSILGKYSSLTNKFYLIPDNIISVSKTLELDRRQIRDFIFLVIAHEMVHALDDQHFDLQERILSIKDAEKAQAFNALMEGHAVYVTDIIAERFNISETARELSVKSSAGISGTTGRIEQETFYTIYIKGCEFVKALADINGPEAITSAFRSPPVSTRQILFPNEYLSPSNHDSIDCFKLLKSVSKEIPAEIEDQEVIPIGAMVLRTIIISQGLTEKEADSVAAGCINGAGLINASIKESEKGTIDILIISFKNSGSVQEFIEIGAKIGESEISRLNAGMNSSCKYSENTDIDMDGFDSIIYQESEKTVDDKTTAEKTLIAVADTLYTEISFTDSEEAAKEDLIKVLEIIKTKKSELEQPGLQALEVFNKKSTNIKERKKS